MLNYVICEILGKQYKFIPGRSWEVLWSGTTDKNIKVNILLLSEDGKIKLGRPYLKDKINLKVLETKKGKKISIRKYHAKANYRKNKGFRPIFAEIALDVKNPILT